jgi:hypothetical protein
LRFRAPLQPLATAVAFQHLVAVRHPLLEGCSCSNCIFSFGFESFGYQFKLKLVLAYA